MSAENSTIIREATAADVPALATLHVKTFNETHRSFNAPALETRKWQWENIFRDQNDNWFCLVIENEKEGLIGFAKGQPYNHADHPQFSGELNKIYLLRKYQKSGLGRKLICKVAGKFLQTGITSMLLFGDANNPSNKFYERMGGEKLFAKNGEFHGGYGWTDLHQLRSNCQGM